MKTQVGTNQPYQRNYNVPTQVDTFRVLYFSQGLRFHVATIGLRS